MSNPFYDPSRRIHLRTGNEAYKDYLDRVKNESKASKSKKDKQTHVTTIPSTEFSLEDLTDFYRVNCSLDALC